ncbi:MAG: ester cyclase [Acidimicrobiia bacterium]
MQTGGGVMTVKGNEAALMRAVEAWNSGNVDSYMELYAQNLKLHAGTYDFPDRAAVERMYKGFHAATSGLVLYIHESFGDEDKLAVRYTVTGTHTGELMGIPPTGREFSMTGITIMHFDGGKVVERWDFDDSSEVLSRLGADSTN